MNGASASSAHGVVAASPIPTSLAVPKPVALAPSAFTDMKPLDTSAVAVDARSWSTFSP